MPEEIDLGSQEAGRPAVGRVEIHNAGGAELVISDIRSSCSCTGIETVQSDGTYLQPTELVVPPGGSVQAAVRLGVNGLPGQRIGTAVEFSTNDPSRPRVTLPVSVASIRGGVRVHPESIPFGTVPVGRTVEKYFDVWDHSPAPRRILRDESSHPGSVKAAISSDLQPPAGKPDGRFIGRVVVTVNTTVPTDVDDKVSVWLTGDVDVPPTVVEVVGHVMPSVRCTPSTLVLPVKTDDGLVYRGTVLFLSHGDPFALKVSSHPPGYRVTLPRAVPVCS